MPTSNDFSLLVFFLDAMLRNTEPHILCTQSAFLGQHRRYSNARPSIREASLAFSFRRLALHPLSELSLLSFLLGAILRKTIPVVFRRAQPECRAKNQGTSLQAAIRHIAVEDARVHPT